MSHDDAESRRRGMKAAADEMLRAYRAIDKMDRWSGGGQRLALLVKIVGWVGMLCILYALVIKMNEVAQSLDPVRNGIARLATQLEQSRAALAAEEERRQKDAAQLSAAAAQVRESTAKLQHAVAAVLAAQEEAAQAAAEATRLAREGQEKLRGQSGDAAAAQAALLKALEDAAKSTMQARDSIAKASAEVARSGAAAVNAAQAMSSDLQQVDRSVAAIDVTQLKKSVSRASVAAGELTTALEKAAKARPRAPSPGSGAVASKK